MLLRISQRSMPRRIPQKKTAEKLRLMALREELAP